MVVLPVPVVEPEPVVEFGLVVVVEEVEFGDVPVLVPAAAPGLVMDEVAPVGLLFVFPDAPVMSVVAPDVEPVWPVVLPLMPVVLPL